MSLPEGYFANELVKINKPKCRARILNTLHHHNLEDEEHLIMIVKKKDYDQTLQHFQNNYGLSLDDSIILADAIGKEESVPQGNISQLQMTTALPPPPSQQLLQELHNVTRQFSNFRSELSIFKSEIRSEIKASQQKEMASPISASNKDYGLVILSTLQNINQVHIQKPGVGASIFSQDIVNQAKKLKNDNKKEKYLVNLYTPYLQEIVEEINPLVNLINSEEYPWLRASSGHTKCDMKPDLFVAYYALVEIKDPYNHAPECEVNRLFGRFPYWNCRSSIWCILDAKWKIDNAAFSEKSKYLQLCGRECRIWQGVGQILKLILFDIEEFWMIEGLGEGITKLTKCKWTQSGSRQVLKDFLTTNYPWMESTENLLKSPLPPMDTNAPPPVPNEPPIIKAAILGAGAYGRAFLLTNGNVLKVAVGPNAAKLQNEYNTIQNLQNNPNTQNFVIPVVPNTFKYIRDDQCEYAGYLLKYKGETIRSTCPRFFHNDTTNSPPGDLEIKLVKFLYDFHLTGHVHGDPRVDNVLLKDGELKWIDFMPSSLPNILARVNDFSILFSSLTGVDVETIYPVINDILNPLKDICTGMSQLSTSDQPLSKIDQLIKYLDKLWNIGVREEGIKEDENNSYYNSNDGYESKTLTDSKEEEK